MTASTTPCGRLGCDEPAAYVIKQPYDVPLYRCDGHVADTAAVHEKFANRQTAGVRVERLETTGTTT